MEKFVLLTQITRRVQVFPSLQNISITKSFDYIGGCPTVKDLPLVPPHCGATPHILENTLETLLLALRYPKKRGTKKLTSIRPKTLAAHT